MSCTFWIQRKKKAAMLAKEKAVTENPKVTDTEKTSVSEKPKKPTKKAGAKNDKGTG